MLLFVEEGLLILLSREEGVIDFHGLVVSNITGFRNSVFVNSALVSSGSAVFFTVRVVPGQVPGNAVSNCLVRITVTGTSLSKTPQELTGDSGYTQFPQNLAPAFSLDGTIMYVVVSSAEVNGLFTKVAMIGVEPGTLTLVQRSDNSPMIIPLFDPEAGVNFPSIVSDVSTSSPVVGPDGDVYFGVRGNPSRTSLGWLLHFDRELSVRKVSICFLLASSVSFSFF